MTKSHPTSHKLCLLDTNIISEMAKNKRNELENFFSKFVSNGNVSCLTIWSILELRKKQFIYKKFLDLFTLFPFCILKPYYILLKEEFNNYPNIKLIDPIMFTFDSFKYGNLEDFFEDIFDIPEIKESEKYWKEKWPKEILRSILSLRKNFSSKGDFYNAYDANKFLDLGIPNYLLDKNNEWYNNDFSSTDAVDLNYFPSVKTTFYTVFYRFYAEKREPELQDIFDIQINCIAPYLNTVIVEKFQAEIFKKVRNKDDYIKHLEIYSLKDLRTK